uniref:Uncharacterized protein LOC104221404 n=1 Tax=Nicotiana sylvestris TaxID=4096 RepID=A0A1U7W7Y3_NICSY|nr:PREDICTED: uncharacterized protein LOC104221404 [Nicotiana sylvestris]
MGIEINADKIKAIEEITVVINVKAVQRLTGRIAALGKFISSFECTLEYQRALEELKRYLTSPPLLHTPKEDEMLYLYLAVSEVAVSGVLVREEQVIEEGHAEINSTSLTWDWRNKCIDYLESGKLPEDPKESRSLRTKAARFSLDENGTLYRRTFAGPLAVCLGPGDTDYVLREIHEGTCKNHSGADSLIRKVIRAGYYLDIMEKDTKEFVQKCDKCQRFAPMIHQPGD